MSDAIVKPLPYRVDLAETIKKTYLETLFATEDNEAHRFDITLLRDKAKLTLPSGTAVSAYFIRYSDNVTLPLNGGSVSGNVVSVTLKKSCYNKSGQFALIIKVTNGGVISTVFYGEGTMFASSTDSVIDKENVIPSLEDLLAQIAVMDAATNRANTAAARAESLAINASGYAGDSNKLGGKAPEYYLQPRNLLDNSDFRNPVNQRVQTSYTGSGYGIDRWRTNFSGDTTSIVSGGLKNTINSTTDGWHVHQISSDKERLVGKSVTLAVHVNTPPSSDIRFVCSFRNSSDGEISNIKISMASGLNVVSGKVPSGTVSLRVGAYAYGASAGDSFVLEWAALYEGEYTLGTLPPYRTKENELAKCQEYAVGLSDQTRMRASRIGGHDIDVFIPLPSMMANTKTVPSFESEAFEVRNLNEVKQEGFSFSIIRCGYNGVLLRATKTNHGLTDCEIRTNKNTVMSRDL